MASYDLNDPAKIQGRDEVYPGERSLAALRLERALWAVEGENLDVLNPGCGAGRYARAMARERPSWRVVGGDLSEVAIREAERAGGGPEYLVLDAEGMPFEDQSFDAIIFFDLLEHLPHPDRFLRECDRTLRPGGTLHFFVPLEAQPGTLYSLLRDDRPIPIHRWKHDHVGHIQRYADADVLQMTWDAGLVVTAVAHSFHLVGQIHDLLDYWQRERARGGPGLMPLRVVQLICRAAFIATWRISYLEDCLYSGRVLASGLHLTAVRPERG
ncbi:MAG: class I SAM-dependent methyltransferase [Chloroflexota bacterium]